MLLQQQLLLQLLNPRLLKPARAKRRSSKKLVLLASSVPVDCAKTAKSKTNKMSEEKFIFISS